MIRARAAALAFALLGCDRSAERAVPDASPVASAAPSALAAGPAASATVAHALRVVEASSDSDARSLVRAERLRAKADGRVLVVYVGATWCEPCKKLKEEIRSGSLDARFARVTLLAFDADKDDERLRAAGFTYKFIPYVALPGPDGSPLESDQATGKGADAWRALLTKLDQWNASAAP